jgi:hypothetical protein
VVREERTGHFMISTHRDFPTLSYLCAPIIPPTPVYTRKALCIRVAVVDALDHSILIYTRPCLDGVPRACLTTLPHHPVADATRVLLVLQINAETRGEQARWATLVCMIFCVILLLLYPIARVTTAWCGVRCALQPVVLTGISLCDVYSCHEILRAQRTRVASTSWRPSTTCGRGVWEVGWCVRS